MALQTALIEGYTLEFEPGSYGYYSRWWGWRSYSSPQPRYTFVVPGVAASSLPYLEVRSSSDFILVKTQLTTGNVVVTWDDTNRRVEKLVATQESMETVQDAISTAALEL